MECSLCMEEFDARSISRFDAVIEGGKIQATWRDVFACYVCAAKLRSVINDTIFRDLTP